MQSPYKNYFYCGLIVLLITAYFSNGWFHPDEHFQILEFANWKLGKITAQELAWEFNEKIRSSLQPTLAFLFIKFLGLFSIENPFYIIIILRMITAIITWYLICLYLIEFIKELKNDDVKKLLCLMFLIWFIPLISVRFTSESWSNIFFLIAVYLSQYKYNEKPISKLILVLIGFLFAMAFYFRFQISFAILGWACWLIISKKYNILQNMLILWGFIIGIVTFTGLDYWFYGEFFITPYNYFYSNIINKVAAQFGVFPWWAYFSFFIIKAIPPISILLLIFFLIGFIKIKKNIYFYILLFFYGIHFIISHKEIRFLFPLNIFFIYFIFMAIDNYYDKIKKIRSFIILTKICVFINFLVLFYVMFFPTNVLSPKYKFIYDYAKNEKIQVLTTGKRFYYFDDYLNVSFYTSKNVQTILCKNELDKMVYLKTYQPQKIIVQEDSILSTTIYPGYKVKTLYLSIPKFLTNYNYNNWLSRIDATKLVELTKEN